MLCNIWHSQASFELKQCGVCWTILHTRKNSLFLSPQNFQHNKPASQNTTRNKHSVNLFFQTGPRLTFHSWDTKSKSKICSLTVSQLRQTLCEVKNHQTKNKRKNFPSCQFQVFFQCWNQKFSLSGVRAQHFASQSSAEACPHPSWFWALLQPQNVFQNHVFFSAEDTNNGTIGGLISQFERPRVRLQIFWFAHPPTNPSREILDFVVPGAIVCTTITHTHTHTHTHTQTPYLSPSSQLRRSLAPPGGLLQTRTQIELITPQSFIT